MFDPISLAIYVGLTLASQTLAARKARKKISDVEFPTNDANRKIPYVAGTVELSPHVIDWGDFKRSSVRTEFPAWLNWLFPVTAIIDQIPFGYRYYVGMVLGLCYGPGVTIKAIKAADHLVWTGSQSGGSLTVAKPGEFGAEGGLYAVCDHVEGSMGQLRNSYWNTIRPYVPAFRGTSVLYWHGPSAGDAALGKIKYSGYIGRTTVVKDFKIRVARFPDNLGTAVAVVNTNHANFAEVIYELLTDQIVGLGLATSLVDSDSFAAAAETLSDESLGCSLKWEQPTEIVDILTRLLETIDAALYSSLDTGEITLKLIRPDYDLAALVSIDETQTGVELQLDRSDPNNAVGEIRIPFIDVEHNFAEAEALAQSISNRLQQGNVTAITLERFGLGDATAANKIATRELRALAVPLDRGTLRVNREAYSFTVGQAFKLSWTPYELEETVFRVLEIDYGTLQDGKITLKIVEDQFSIGETQFGAVVSNSWTDPVIITPADDVVRTVESITTTAPPGSPTVGDRYIVPAGATAAWAGFTNQIATWNGTAWIFETTDDLLHAVVFNDADDLFYRWTGSAWVSVVTTAYNTIQDEGVDVTPRREILNFIGSGVTATDNPGNNRTNVTITPSPLKLLFEFGDGKNSTSLEANQTSRFPDVPTGTISKVRIEGDATGSAVVDIQTSTADPPSYSSICASAKPTLSSDKFAEDSTLTGWTTAVAEGTKFLAVIDSVSGMKQVAVVLTIVRT